VRWLASGITCAALVLSVAGPAAAGSVGAALAVTADPGAVAVSQSTPPVPMAAAVEATTTRCRSLPQRRALLTRSDCRGAS
jgi:hypothetical protein